MKLVTKNNEPFSICDKFSNMVSEIVTGGRTGQGVLSWKDQKLYKSYKVRKSSFQF